MNRPLLLARGLLAPLLLLTACHVRDRTERRWIGPLTASQPTSQCPTTKGVLILREGIVTFAPDEGTWVLTGTGGSNTLTATRSRPIADHKIYRTDLQADWTEEAVRGTYKTPECTYRVDLRRY